MTLTYIEAKQEWKDFKAALLVMLVDDLLIWQRFRSKHCMQITLQRFYEQILREKEFRSIWTDDKVYTVRIK